VPLVSLVLLTACTTTGPLLPNRLGPSAPAGTAQVPGAVDGLTVGHRLMTAGQYDLALKAYYRAGAETGLTAELLSAIGAANLRLGRLGQAETQLRRAVELDERSAPAWNNLGVVLMEKGELGEARRVFEIAYALDSGQSDDIRENLRRAIAKTEIPDYDAPKDKNHELVRQGSSAYRLVAVP